MYFIFEFGMAMFAKRNDNIHVCSQERFSDKISKTLFDKEIDTIVAFLSSCFIGESPHCKNYIKKKIHILSPPPQRIQVLLEYF